jgi:hypothetical protein
LSVTLPLLSMLDKIMAVRRRVNAVAGILRSIGRVEKLCESLEDATLRSLQVQRELLLQQLLQRPRYAERRRLNSFEASVFSQSGQDGIIDEIMRRIGTTNQLCVEFGVGAGGGFENNSTYLLAKGWTGCWIEADPVAGDRIRRQMDFLIRTGRLRLRLSRVTVENIVELFEQLEVPREFDLLSIDIDSFDYWVWRSLSDYRPRVVVIEYNSFLPASADWIMPYDPESHWDGNSMVFSASLKAFEKLGEAMGYKLVGCDLSGSDAFFVRADLVGEMFCDPFTAENHHEPMRYYLIQRWGYRRTLSSAFGRIG